MTETNTPKVLVEFTPEEITWMADRFHEMRGQWMAAELLGGSLTAEGRELSPTNAEKLAKAKVQIEEHKKMEAALRNRIIDKAAEQGFGNL